MVRDEKMYEEIDKATTAQMSINLLENYAMLLRIKKASNPEQVLDEELQFLEMKMKVLNIEYEILN